MWVSWCIHTSPPSWASFPSPHPAPTPLGHLRAPSWASCAIYRQVPTSYFLSSLYFILLKNLAFPPFPHQPRGDKTQWRGYPMNELCLEHRGSQLSVPLGPWHWVWLARGWLAARCCSLHHALWDCPPPIRFSLHRAPWSAGNSVCWVLHTGLLLSFLA